MPTIVIPRNATTAPCPDCGRILRNLSMLGIHRHANCGCGAIVVVDRRDAEGFGTARRQSDRHRKYSVPH
jgi:hypothetical protein